MACVTAESLARLFIDEGLVFVSASCVFSSFNSCVALPALTTTRGIRDLEAGIALALGPGSVGVNACEGVGGASEGFFLEAASMAFNSVSVTPAPFRRINSLVEVLNLPGLA